MRFLVPLLVAILGFAALYLGTRGLARRVYPGSTAVLRGLAALPYAWAAAFVTAVLARLLDAPGLAHVGFGAAAAVVVLMLATLPFLGLGAALRALADRRPEPEPEPEPAAAPSATPSADASIDASIDEKGRVASPARRDFLTRTATVVPAGGLVLAGAGGLGGFEGAHLVELTMTFPDLPDALEGFRILHYTDMHLGTYVDLYEVSRLADLGQLARPDLVVLTGDMSDDVDAYRAALQRFEKIRSRHGVVASIGNHEYFRGIRAVTRAYAQTDVALLVEANESLDVGGARLFIGGADDPRVLRGDKMAFMARTVEAALDGAPSEDAFRLLLSHRPEGFVPGAKAGFDLTLSGHTHGAQLGFDGRSLLERFMPDHYLWGAYSNGPARLYTSSGAGHWFPFRLGCPREVPLIVLKKGPAGTDVIRRRLA